MGSGLMLIGLAWIILTVYLRFDDTIYLDEGDSYFGDEKPIRIERCPNCGALSRSPTCAYCGGPNND